jgi:hypothetical protein
MATVSPMPAKADPAWIRAPDALCPTVGANYGRGKSASAHLFTSSFITIMVLDYYFD